MKSGRNDPCPCGSGKKYKHCCGLLQDKGSSAERMPSGDAYLQEFLQRGLNYHQSGHLPQAEAAYRQVLKVAPDHPDALYLCGLAVHESGRSEAAVELIARAINVNPTGSFYYTLGNVFRKLEKLDEAAVNYRAALKLTPGLAEAHLGLGNVLKAQDKPDEAAEHFRRALKLKPDLIEAHLNLGNTLRAQGKLDEAIERFRNTVRLRPDYAEAYNNLGGALRERGDLDAAIANFRQALELKPDMAGAHNNLGMALQSRGELDAAIDSFEKALMLKPDYAEAGFNIGNVFKEQNKLDAAIACYRKVLEFRPDMSEAHSNLGGALSDQGKHQAATESFHKALAIAPDCISAHLGLGNMLREMGELESATESFRKAFEIEPDSIRAHLGMSALYQDMGKFDASRMHLDQVLALKPDHPLAWAALSTLRKMTPDDQAWAEKAQGFLENGLLPQEEIRLCYALGKYHDDTRQYESAFGCYARANHLKRKSAGHFDRDEFRRSVDSIIAAHPVEVVRQPQAGNSASRRPLFIVGMPRSGTSLTEQILASHPDIFGAGELHFWGTQSQKHFSKILSGYYEVALLQDIATQCEAELQRHSTAALRVVDKMPTNFLYLGLIHAVFPQARILHTQRNLIDTCLSIHFQNFSNGHTYANDLHDLAFYYREYWRLMAHWRAVLPPEVFLDVPYEALVEDQEGWSRRIIEFAGLEWDERCLDFHETERKVGTASNWQVRQKIYKTSKERWRNYEQFVGPLLPLLELTQ